MGQLLSNLRMVNMLVGMILASEKKIDNGSNMIVLFDTLVKSSIDIVDWKADFLKRVNQRPSNHL